MKKYLPILIVFLLSMFLAACGGNDADADTGADVDNTNTSSENNEDKESSPTNESENQSEDNSDEASEEGDSSALPAEVPSDFPFPDGASLNVTTMEMSGGMSYIVTFDFTEDPEATFQSFKDYANNNGYSIAIEDSENFRFSSTKSPTEGLVVEISAMSSVNIGTVTFTVPTE